MRSAVRALMGLCAANHISQIGATGPVAASGHRAEDAHVSELRKFEVVFGRDSLITARLVYDLFPRLTAGTVRALARYQGKRWDAASEEEPGRIAHEVRDPLDPVAQAITKTNGWKWPYYGAIDTTPLFISAIVRLARSGERVDDLREPLVAAVEWLLGRLSAEDQMLVSHPSNPRGIENQVWKDSWDAFSHRDGTIAKPPLAPIDAQAVAFDACVDGAWILERLGADGRRPKMLRLAAARIRAVVLDDFVVREGCRSIGVSYAGAGMTPRA